MLEHGRDIHAPELRLGDQRQALPGVAIDQVSTRTRRRSISVSRTKFIAQTSLGPVGTSRGPRANGAPAAAPEA
jgi:hypothetical protein